MITREPKVQYVLTLEATAGADDAHIRTLRLLLKRLLRTHSLRCTKIQQINCRDDGGER